MCSVRRPGTLPVPSALVLRVSPMSPVPDAADRLRGGPGEAVWSGHRPGGTLELHAPQRQE